MKAPRRGGFAKYWLLYGGWRSIARSKYTRVAAVLTAALYPLWTAHLTAGAPAWWDTTLSILPNVLGFSLGGYAILVSFGNDRFKRLLATTKKGQDPSAASAFMVINATFVHFIVVQVLALVLSLLCKAWGAPVGGALHVAQLVAWGFSFFTFIYSLLLALAAAFSVFRMGDWFDTLMSIPEGEQRPPARAVPTEPPRVADGSEEAERAAVARLRADAVERERLETEADARERAAEAEADAAQRAAERDPGVTKRRVGVAPEDEPLDDEPHDDEPHDDEAGKHRQRRSSS